MLQRVKAWLEMPVEESDERGRKQRTTRNRDEGRGTPQGAPLSPLLSNLYMRRFILGWKVLGHERRCGPPGPADRERLAELPLVAAWRGAKAPAESRAREEAYLRDFRKKWGPPLLDIVRGGSTDAIEKSPLRHELQRRSFRGLIDQLRAPDRE